jgi:hypothetical protein
MKREYPSQLTFAQWEVLRRRLPRQADRGRRPIDRRRILNALWYVVRTGCQWRQLPKEFPFPAGGDSLREESRQLRRLRVARSLRVGGVLNVRTTYCHFIQTCNHLRYCPIGEPGDTRTVVIGVPTIAKPIDRDELSARLTAEAPAYLWTLLNTPLPPSTGRLWLPIVDTPERRLLIEMRTSPVERFVSECVDEVAHERILAAEFVERLQRWYLDTLGKGDSIGKQDIYAQLRGSESSITYVPSHHGAHIENARWK